MAEKQQQRSDLDDTDNIKYFCIFRFGFYFQDDSAYNYLQKQNHMVHICDLYNPKLSLVNEG